MDMETMAQLVPIEWVPDRLNAQDAKPRHLGRPISFFYHRSTDPENYDGEDILGILEGVRGTTFIVSGDEYDSDRMTQTKVWRRKVKTQ